MKRPWARRAWSPRSDRSVAKTSRLDASIRDGPAGQCAGRRFSQFRLQHRDGPAGTNPSAAASFPAVSTRQGFEIAGAGACPRVPHAVHSREFQCASSLQWHAQDAGAGSSFSPMPTIRSAPSERGRCSDFASSHETRSQTSYSSAVSRITGIALGWTRLTYALGSQVRNPKRSVLISPSFALRTLVQFVHSPANAIRGRVSS